MLTKIPKDWYEKSVRRFMIGFHVPDVDQYPAPDILKEFDPVKFVKILKGVGVEVFYFYAKGGLGNSYYPTKVGHAHSAMRGRDFCQEMIDACMERDIIPCMVYEVNDQGRVRKDNPEWCHRHPLDKGGYLQECINSPYGEFILAQTEEILRNYRIGEIMYDMVDFASSSSLWKCPYCEKILEERLGRKWTGENSLTEKEWPEYIKFRYDIIKDFLVKVVNLRDKIAPDVLVSYNFHGYLTWKYGNNWENTAKITDCFFADIFCLRDGNMVDVSIPKAFEAHSQKRPWILVDTAISSVSNVFDSVKPKPLSMYKAEIASLCANGCWPCTSSYMNYTGKFEQDNPLMATIKEINRDIKNKQKWLINTTSLPCAAIVFPELSRDFLGRVEKENLYRDEFNGWAKLLLENHILFNVLSEGLLTEENLSKYSILVLPAVTCLADAQLKNIGNFVKKGGVLVSTAGTSLSDQKAVMRENFGLADVFGVNFHRDLDKSKDVLVLSAEKIIDKNRLHSNQILMREGQVLVSPRENAQVLGYVGGKVNPEALDTTLTEFPALVENNSGKGVSYYFPGWLGLTYGRCPYPELKSLISRILRKQIKKSAPVLVDAPGCVQIEGRIQENKHRIIIHLINLQSNPDRSLMTGDKNEFISGLTEEILPVYGIKIKFRDKKREVKEIYSIPEKKKIYGVRNGEWIEIKIAKLDIHEMIVFQK